MAIHRPSLFTNSDTLLFRQTPPSEYRIPYTFVESLNEGTLFDRPVRTFEEAARTQRLYDVVVGDDQRIIGAGMLQDTLQEANGLTYPDRKPKLPVDTIRRIVQGEDVDTSSHRRPALPVEQPAISPQVGQRERTRDDERRMDRILLEEINDRRAADQRRKITTIMPNKFDSLAGLTN